MQRKPICLKQSVQTKMLKGCNSLDAFKTFNTGFSSLILSASLCN